MLKLSINLILIIIFLQGCISADERKITAGIEKNPAVVSEVFLSGTRVIEEGRTVETRFQPPEGYVRITEEEGSFASYLRRLPLKKSGTEVMLYNGTTKPAGDVYIAVVDLPIGKRDLHQCADAVIRLRAEYLYGRKKYEAIHFNFTNGFRADYSEWMKGNRIEIENNRTWWVRKAEPSDSYGNFWSYLETVFMYAGTRSLAAELDAVQRNDMKIGDVFIQGGSPGHAIIIIDMAVDKSSGKKTFLLAQSYMPAQEIQVLKNPVEKDLSPWYSLDFGEVLITPEWAFRSGDLKRFIY